MCSGEDVSGNLEDAIEASRKVHDCSVICFWRHHFLKSSTGVWVHKTLTQCAWCDMMCSHAVWLKRARSPKNYARHIIFCIRIFPRIILHTKDYKDTVVTFLYTNLSHPKYHPPYIPHTHHAAEKRATGLAR